MIDIKPPEYETTDICNPVDLNTPGYKRMPEDNPWEEFWKRIKDATGEGKVYVPVDNSTDAISKELHEISNTLKDILREMRKRKV